MTNISLKVGLVLTVKIVVIAVTALIILVVSYRWTVFSRSDRYLTFTTSRTIYYLPRCFKNISNLAENVSETRVRMQIRCNQSEASVISELANRSVGVFSLNWTQNLQCLKNFVSRNCYTRKGQVVPNIVHYVSFGHEVFRAWTFISVLSVVRFQQPCAVLFHGPDPPSGPYWLLLVSIVPNVIHVTRAEPTTIFGKSFGFIQHKSDVVRLEVLNALGGMYLDNDQILVRNVSELQNESFVMSHENKNNLANSMMLARPGAAFINLWYDQYRDYDPKQWAHHSTIIPWILAQQNASLIKIVGYRFVDPDLFNMLTVFNEHYNITTNYGLHLFWRMYPKIQLNLPDVTTWNSTLGELWRTILYGRPDFYQPCAVLFHGPDPPSGPYWVLLVSIVPNVIHVTRAEPTTIFGKRFGFIQHKSDVVRLEVLNALGGMYLDNDQILVRNVSELQNESFVMSHENKNNLANSMMLARPGAAFINLWYDQYRDYDPKQWAHHSTIIPWILAQQNASLIKIVGYRFVDPDLFNMLTVFNEHYNITTNYGLHLFWRMYPKIQLNLPDVTTWNSTLGELWRTILYGRPDFYVCPESPT